MGSRRVGRVGSSEVDGGHRAAWRLEHCSGGVCAGRGAVTPAGRGAEWDAAAGDRGFRLVVPPAQRRAGRSKRQPSARSLGMTWSTASTV